ncbi:MAG: hypothetical protein M1837_004280 [Sclerophora amabilis]|nr:MAG: hypothetical protein M1837_004280 [Sclerophora amabilis]
MGWWWNSTTSVSHQNNEQSSARNIANDDTTVRSSSCSPSTHTTRPSPPSSPSSKSLSRDEQADLELRTFLDSLNNSHDDDNNNRSSSADRAQSTSSASSSIAQSQRTTDPSSLYPSEMSCTQAFDQAVYCYSLGGQFMNVYRYGGLKDCSEHWGAFWFCMRTKSYSDEERAEMVQGFYKGKAAKYKVDRSSEDVWEGRTEAVDGSFGQG